MKGFEGPLGLVDGYDLGDQGLEVYPAVFDQLQGRDHGFEDVGSVCAGTCIHDGFEQLGAREPANRLVGELVARESLDPVQFGLKANECPEDFCIAFVGKKIAGVCPEG